MEYLGQFIDLHRRDIDPERVVIALAIHSICRLINHGGSDIGRLDDDLALHPYHLEAFLAHMDYFSMIDFAVDGYAYLSASRVYPDNATLRNWAINEYMLMWSWHFLKNQERGERAEGRIC
jgi:hypothetical protein